jgi:hypothetical protein
MIKRLINFIRYNDQKWMSVQIGFYAAFYRLCILIVPMKKIETMLGERGEESQEEETIEHLRIAKSVAIHVNHVASRTPWESKCLVRAMTARKILDKKGIASTLYLGVGKKEDKMIAHAWLRCGQMYVTGGDGSQYSMVAKFCTMRGVEELRDE